MFKYFPLLLMIVLCSFVNVTFAQSDAVTVPDLTGFDVPRAAAELNRNGLRLGNEQGVAWTESSPYPAGFISGQSIAPGETATYGTTIDIQVFSTANVTLIYDDNDITFVNQTGNTLDITEITFNATDGSRLFAASDWQPTIDDGNCGQLWSVTTRREAKRLPECGAIRWIGTNDASKHFWTSLAGVTDFRVLQSGIEQVLCPAAPAGTEPLRCSFFVAGQAGSAEINTDYLYFTYTADRFAMINKSTDRWMPVTSTALFSATTEAPVSVTVPEWLNNEQVVGDVNRLAPGQCVLLTTGDTTLPESCDVIATATISTEAAFWQNGFQIDSQTDNERERRFCPPADLSRRTLCVMPR